MIASSLIDSLQLLIGLWLLLLQWMYAVHATRSSAYGYCEYSALCTCGARTVFSQTYVVLFVAEHCIDRLFVTAATFVNRFCTSVFAEVLMNKDALTVKNALELIFSQWNDQIPKECLTDHGELHASDGTMDCFALWQTCSFLRRAWC